MKRKCLYCYEAVDGAQDFHEKCSMEFFGTPTPPVIEYSLDQMDELAKNVVLVALLLESNCLADKEQLF